MGRACDTTANDILDYPHSHIAMTVQIFVTIPDISTTVRVIQMERVENGGPIARHNHDYSRLYVVVQRTQIARREHVAEFRERQTFRDALASTLATRFMPTIFKCGGERVAMAATRGTRNIEILFDGF